MRGESATRQRLSASRQETVSANDRSTDSPPPSLLKKKEVPQETVFEFQAAMPDPAMSPRADRRRQTNRVEGVLWR
jgi:hypothetical protein